MSESRNALTGKRKYLYGSMLLAFVALICGAFSMSRSTDFDIARREILLRKIGHEILLQSGDSTSRVLPVKKIAENEYRISFNNEFTFEPGLLVNTTRRLLATDPLASDYVVNVLNCADASVAYGYAVSKNKKDDIVACIGRVQPIGCYEVIIKFKPAPGVTTTGGYLLGGLSLLAMVGLVFFGAVKPRKVLATLPESLDFPESHNDIITLGAMSFDAGARKLIINGDTTYLTNTETRVLRIFALSPNETIDRSRLQKEIWEDEGVIVGRSLDMFISKLRRKLAPDPNVNIVVIRGKGYKLEIGA